MAPQVLSATTIDISTPVTALPGVGERVREKLRRLGVETVAQLIRHWPRRWDDFRQLTPFTRLVRDATVVVRGTLHDISLERRRGKRLVQVRAVLRDETGNELPVVWYNQAYLVRTLQENRPYVLAGPLRWDWHRKCLVLTSPRRDIVQGLHAVYPETDGLTSRQLRSFIEPVLPKLALPDPLASSSGDYLPLIDAVRMLHRPATPDETVRGRARIAFDEHLQLQLALERRRRYRAQQRAVAIAPSVGALQHFVRSLPYVPTGAQRAAAWRIIQALDAASPTRHLLQGDVGTGKTLVAALVAVSVLEAGHNVIWLAPTQVLARQLADRLGVLLAPNGHRVQVRIQGIELQHAEEPMLFVGTHALLGNQAKLRPGLVVIDEQQRFGVTQRESLTTPVQGMIPHALAMTATPIPRSLSLAILGDDELVTLTERPEHQQPSTTVRLTDRTGAFPALRAVVTERQQAFVVVPRIDGVAETLFASTIEEVSAAYRRAIPAARIGVLHGRLDSTEQEATLNAFLCHELDILVATTMVEVGVDVPNATVMVIEEAAQFGLAQLHQLRGRVGRGKIAGQCFVIESRSDEGIDQRLDAFVRSQDGFELARLDLQFRGPGELLGTIQAGLPELSVASLDDTLAIERARSVAKEWLDTPPAELKPWLEFYGNTESEGRE